MTGARAGFLIPLAVVIGVACLLWFAADDEPTGSTGPAAEPPAVPAPPSPELAGRPNGDGAADPDPATYATETDVRVLARALWLEQTARDRLVDLGAADPAVVIALVDWLHPRHDAERRASFDGRPCAPTQWNDIVAVFRVLAALGTAAVDPLLAALEDPEYHLRLRVVHCLGFLGENGAQAAPVLVSRIESGADPDLTGEMIGALGCMGRAAGDSAPVVRAHLADDQKSDRVRAAAAGALLPVSGPTPEAFEACRTALRDGSYEVTVNLLPTIGSLGPKGAPLTEAVHLLLLDREAHEWVQLHAIETLGFIARGNDAVLATLLDIVSGEGDASEQWRVTATNAITRLGADALARLIERANSEGDALRLFVARTLGEGGLAGRFDADPILAMLDALRSSGDEDDREAAIAAAGPHIRFADTGIDWALRWQSDKSAGVRAEALGALEAVIDGEGRILAGLRTALGDPAALVRTRAIEALFIRTEFEMDSADVRTPIIEQAVALCLTDTDPEVRREAALLLHHARPDDTIRALPVWIEMLGSMDPYGHDVWTAAQILEGLGPRAREAIPALEKALARTAHPRMKERIQKTLEALGRE